MKKAKDGIQLVSVTNHFKFQAPDGKQRYADALDAECVQTVLNIIPITVPTLSSIGYSERGNKVPQKFGTFPIIS